MTAHSATAENCGLPTPVIIRVVHIAPGPTPTLMTSAPASTRSRTPSAVTTLPATTGTVGLAANLEAIIAANARLAVAVAVANAIRVEADGVELWHVEGPVNGVQAVQAYGTDAGDRTVSIELKLDRDTPLAEQRRVARSVLATLDLAG